MRALLLRLLPLLLLAVALRIRWRPPAAHGPLSACRDVTLPRIRRRQAWFARCCCRHGHPRAEGVTSWVRVHHVALQRCRPPQPKSHGTPSSGCKLGLQHRATPGRLVLCAGLALAHIAAPLARTDPLPVRAVCTLHSGPGACSTLTCPPSTLRAGKLLQATRSRVTVWYNSLYSYFFSLPTLARSKCSRCILSACPFASRCPGAAPRHVRRNDRSRAHTVSP